MPQIVNLIISQSTFVGSHFKESLDLALVCAAFEHQVNLIFQDDGVFNLVKNQQSQIIGEKNLVDLLKGLSFYDIENVYVDNNSLIARSIKPDNLLIEVNCLELESLNSLNRQADQVVVL